MHIKEFYIAGILILCFSSANAQMKLVKDILPGIESGIFRQYFGIALDDKLIFTANAPDKRHRNIWVSDGTEIGTFMIQENVDESGFPKSEPFHFEQLGDKIIFASASPDKGVEPWVTDGTLSGTMMLKDIEPIFNSSFPNHFTRLGNEVYFTLDSDGNIWKTDGTEEGTVKALDPSNHGTNRFIVDGFTALGNMLFFSTGSQLWVTDGTTQGTERLLDISNMTPRIVSELTAINGVLYFTCNKFGDSEPWISDGTEAGTKMIKDIAPGSLGSNPAYYTEYNGEVYFAAKGGLWKTDGTEGGTVLVKGDIDLQPSSIGRKNNFKEFKGELYFPAEFEDTGVEIWKTDGTEAGTMMYDIHNGTSVGVEPEHFTVIGDTMFFSGQESFVNVLWKTDGTLAGTEIVSTKITPSPRSVSALRAVGSKLFFTAYDDQHGTELWIYQSSDATSLSASIVQTSDILCNGDETGALEVQVSGGTAPYSYDWNNPSANGPNPTGLPAGDYSVTVTDTEQSTVVLNYTITEPSAIITMTSSSPETDMMSNGSVSVNVSGGTPPYSYHWFTSPPSYTAEVDSLAAGTYNLIVTDANGCRKGDSATVGTMVFTLNKVNTSEWTVYPIPASDQLYLEFLEASDNQIAKIQLISTDGAVVLEQYASGKKTVLNITKQVSGIFFVKLITEQGISTRKVLIQAGL